MILNVAGQIFTFGIAILFAFGVSYLFDIFLYRLNKKFIFGMPLIFFIAAVVLWILGLLSDDWGALGFLLYASFSTIAFLGSILAALLMWYRKKPKDTSD